MEETHPQNHPFIPVCQVPFPALGKHLCKEQKGTTAVQWGRTNDKCVSEPNSMCKVRRL